MKQALVIYLDLRPQSLPSWFPHEHSAWGGKQDLISAHCPLTSTRAQHVGIQINAIVNFFKQVVR